MTEQEELLCLGLVYRAAYEYKAYEINYDMAVNDGYGKSTVQKASEEQTESDGYLDGVLEVIDTIGSPRLKECAERVCNQAMSDASSMLFSEERLSEIVKNEWEAST